MGTKKFIEDQLEGLEVPIKKSGFFSNYFKKGKLKVIIIYEDMSYKTYFKNFPKSYFLDIKKKSYLVVAKTIIKGKYPTVLYFYNNPLPLFLEYEISSLSSLDLKTDEQKKELRENEEVILKNVFLDSEAVNIAFHTKFLKGLYDSAGFTYKSLIIILIVVAVIVLFFLQIFGVVDVIGAISGAGGKIK